MKKMRISAIALALLLTLNSCGSSSTDQKDTTADSIGTDPIEIDDGRVHDELPDTNLEKREIGILIKEEMASEFDTEESGDIINDAVFKRNRNISERFNCTINYIRAPGGWADRETYADLITSAVLGDDPIYDIVTGQSNIITPMALQGMYVEMSDAKYIDFDKPYWKDGYHDNVKINGKFYTLCGDYALSTFYNSNVIFFNKLLFDEYSMEYPYALVKSGDWTLDAFLALCKGKGIDTDGDGDIEANDLHAFSGTATSLPPFFTSTELHFTVIGSDGKRTIDFPSERAIEVFDKLFAFCHTSDFIQGNDLTEGTGFREGNLFMLANTLKAAEALRDMDVDYGIVPFPKYDSAQEEYHTTVLRTYTIAAVPISAEDHEIPQIILEALACEGYNDIIPVYYEVALGDKYLRDEESIEMLDIINNSTFLTFEDTFYSDLNAISDFLSSYLLNNSEGVASAFESMRPSFQANLDRLYSAFEVN